MKQKPCLGIDVSKAKAECGLLWADSKYRSKVVSNQAVGFAQLRQWLQKTGRLEVPGHRTRAWRE